MPRTVIVPSQPDDSLIISAVHHENDFEMPPDEKLDEREITALVRWIQAGAAWPDGMMLGGSVPKVRGGAITSAERAFWSFQPVTDPQPPQINDGQIRNDARLLWRFDRRRLSAEEIRDAMLLVSGNLDPTMGGEHPFPSVDSWNFTQHAPYYGVYPTNRRSIYLMQQRLKRHPFLALFDGADSNVSTARRELTTVPTQALYLMNNEFVHKQATALTKRLSALSNDENRIERLWQLAFAREASQVEVADARHFLAEYRQAVGHIEMPPADTAVRGNSRGRASAPGSATAWARSTGICRRSS